MTWRVASVGYLLLAIAWALGNPVSAAPDEPQNAVKAYATATGQLGGRPYASPARDLSDRREAWFRRSARVYDLPPRLVPPANTRCYAFDPHKAASCQDAPAPRRAPGDIVGATQLARYLPVLYAPAGVAFASASSYDDGIRRARLVNAVLFAFLVGWALRLAGPRAVAGVVVAVTPMVVFLSASVSTSGLEAAGGVLLWVGALRAFSEVGRASAEPWMAMVVGGAVVALGRGIGPPMVVAVVVLAWFLAVPSAAFGPLRAAWRAELAETSAQVAIVVLALAVVGGVAWTVFAMPHPPFDLGVARDHVGEAWRAMPEQLREAVGVFGWLDTRLSDTVYRVVGAVVAAAVVAAVADRDWRALVLVAIAIGAVVVDIAVAVLVEAQLGYGMQARYVLAFAVGVPIVAARLLARRRALPGAIAAATFVAAGALQVVAFVTNANRYDVELMPQLAIAIAGAALLGAAGLLGLRLGEPDGGVDTFATDEHLEVQV